VRTQRVVSGSSRPFSRATRPVSPRFRAPTFGILGVQGDAREDNRNVHVDRLSADVDEAAANVTKLIARIAIA
jgi:hypothetical protein